MTMVRHVLKIRYYFDFNFNLMENEIILIRSIKGFDQNPI